MYHYLVTEKATGAQHLAEASSPSVAIADAAADKFTADRVDGAVLDVLKKSMTVKRTGKAATTATETGADGAAAGAGEGGETTTTTTEPGTGKPPKS